MSHQKRQKIPKEWPVPRKGTKFIVKPLENKGIPILVLLRDMLKIVRSRKEIKKAIHNKNILINNRKVKDEKAGLTFFDTLTLIPSKKNYKITLNEKGKFDIEEINEKEANFKVAKVINKKILKGKKIQLNLLDGRNFITNLKCKIGDSVLINFKDKKIEKCLPLEEKTKIMVFAGKHAGETGEIIKLKNERKMASIKTEGEKINILIKQLMRIE